MTCLLSTIYFFTRFFLGISSGGGRCRRDLIFQTYRGIGLHEFVLYLMRGNRLSLNSLVCPERNSSAFLSSRCHGARVWLGCGGVIKRSECVPSTRWVPDESSLLTNGLFLGSLYCSRKILTLIESVCIQVVRLVNWADEGKFPERSFSRKVWFPSCG